MTTASKVQHTPGPWEVRPSSNPRNGSNWRDIVSTGYFSPYYVSEAQEHDASLIAAAPELLGAAKDLIEALNFAGNMKSPWHKQRQELRAAIAKAEGQ